ncbi:hypothetical protein CABS01_15011 [Colletotrichum abscissum]|uniref:uncharacterized protein n=1 Tax=Colletotrichum abscissum TaxID=1671311 RepID=UPI0027D5B355|nr:uncharacterized protein CABS01_15011 [Colletotrichum abscissum]KAK1477314.1 hypothetical protein CABS01_15011 [Colletotrichum abscissum]
MSLVSLPSCQSAFVKKTLTTLLHLRRQVNVSKRNLFALRKSTACLHDEHSSADRLNVSSFCPFAANRHCDGAWVPPRPLSWRVNPSRQGTKVSVNQPIFSSQLGLHDGHRPRIARGFSFPSCSSGIRILLKMSRLHHLGEPPLRVPRNNVACCQRRIFGPRTSAAAPHCKDHPKFGPKSATGLTLLQSLRIA